MHDLYAWLEDKSGGIRTFAEFDQKAQMLAREDGENAAILALLAGMAARFVARFEGEPLPVNQANEALVELRDLLLRAAQVSGDGDPAEKLAFVNEVATFDLGAKPAS